MATVAPNAMRLRRYRKMSHPQLDPEIDSSVGLSFTIHIPSHLPLM
jgi:hypothetical protein